MNRIFHIVLSFVLLAICSPVFAQINFRTIAPQDAVIVGESFEIQYVVEGEEKTEGFIAPPFSGFRLVTGPHIYKGSVIDLNVAKPLINTVYTLAAVKPGKYFIPGAKIMLNGTPLNSNDIFIQVISKEEAFRINKRKDGSFYKGSEYFLLPGEDPIEKIRRNLFMRVMVDKHSCYVGEPVVATYKLYSRLESKSDIIKNPGFYGFAVLDMVNLADHAQTIETIDGKTFDVHTVRRVQLYPLQAGQYLIDPMEVSNKVEFSRSEVNKKTEQEIVEGLLNSAGDKSIHNNTEVYESSLKTEALPVTVKPLPAKNKADSFTAAVGNFSIRAELVKSAVKKNEPGSLVISVSGKGNFTQINAPEVKWPSGIDGFEPEIRDSVDRLQVPLSGTKTFRYNFVSDKPGKYELEPVEFNFFNLDTNRFEKLVTKPLTIQVSFQEKEKEKIVEAKKAGYQQPAWYWWAGGFLALIAIALLSVKILRKRVETETPPVDFGETLLIIDEILVAPQIMLAAGDRKFYSELNKSIWIYFSQKTKLFGTGMNKPMLVEYLKSAGIEDELVVHLIMVIQQCETGMYTDAVIPTPREELFEHARQLLKSIDAKL